MIGGFYMSNSEKNSSDFFLYLSNNCDEIISNYTIPDSISKVVKTAVVGTAIGGLFGGIVGGILGGVLSAGANTDSIPNHVPHKSSPESLTIPTKNSDSVVIYKTRTTGKMPDKLLYIMDEPEEQLDIYSDILSYCNQNNIDEVDLYNKAFVSKTVFSKIRSMKATGYKPSKSTIICLCLALNLNLRETQALLNKAGYMLSNDIFVDKVVSYCIESSFYDLYKIETLLSERMHKPVLFKA